MSCHLPLGCVINSVQSARTSYFLTRREHVRSICSIINSMMVNLEAKSMVFYCMHFYSTVLCIGTISYLPCHHQQIHDVFSFQYHNLIAEHFCFKNSNNTILLLVRSCNLFDQTIIVAIAPGVESVTMDYRTPQQKVVNEEFSVLDPPKFVRPHALIKNNLDGTTSAEYSSAASTSNGCDVVLSRLKLPDLPDDCNISPQQRCKLPIIGLRRRRQQRLSGEDRRGGR